ncbi:MAG: hypothetical protein GXP62_01825 [Oligoflexia bacterium]|nr:hypothetical protein [Oligoflexia bacterium]
MTRLVLLLAATCALTGCHHPKTDTDGNTETDVTTNSDTATVIDTNTDTDTDTNTDTATDTGTDTGTNLPGDDLTIHLLPDGMPNLVLPFDVTLDPARRHGYVTANKMPTVIEFDLDSGLATQGWTLGSDLLNFAHVGVDGLGILWVTAPEYPLTRIDPDPSSGSQEALDIGVSFCINALGLDAGGVLLGCPVGSDTKVLRLGPDGAQERQVTIPGVALSIRFFDGGDTLAMLQAGDHSSQTLQLIDPVTLEIRDSCTAPFGATFMAQAQDGTPILSTLEAVAAVGCGADDNRVQIGIENKQAFAIDDQLIVLDRIGTSEEAGPNWGVARVFDQTLQVQRTFSTGKNTGYGGLDTTTGRLWMNSEGTTEVWGMNPATGTVDKKAKVGVYPEILIRDPGSRGVVYVTGRLSDSVLRLDLETGARTDTPQFIGWPVGPVIAGGALWVTDQLDDSLWKLDLTTLAPESHFALGAEVNMSLIFNKMLWHSRRGTLFITQSAANLLLEVDPASGTVLHKWPLFGALNTNTTIIGALEVFEVGDRVVTFRSSDGAITVIDPDSTGAQPGFTMDQDDLDGLDTQQHDGLGWLSKDGAVLYFGGDAYNPAVLITDTRAHGRLPDQDLPLTRVIGQAGGRFIGWSATGNTVPDNSVVVIDAAGNIEQSKPLEPVLYGELSATYADDFEGRIIYLRPDVAEVRSTPFTTF